MIRVGGALYQVIGVCLVSAGINEKLKHFGKPGLAAAILRWFRESPAARKAPGTISGHVTGSAAKGFGVGTVEEKLDHLPVEERITKIYKRVLAADARIANMDHTIRNEVERLEAAIAAARSSVPSQISAYQASLGGVLVGGFKAELLGAALLIIGVLFGTLPGEVAGALD